jgi:sulfotransferase famil protein
MSIDPRQYFFVHIMKTAGGTFKRHIARNLDRDVRYPPEVTPSGREDIYLSTDHLQTLSPEERHAYRVVTGHYPYACRHLLDDDVVTFTLLRDPIERTISHVRMLQRLDPRLAELSLAEVYDDPASRSFFFDNYQARVFAYDDPANPTVMADVEWDDHRMEVAKKNLATIDLFGFRERLDEFLHEVSARYGWEIHVGVKSKNVAAAEEIDPELRSRIEADNTIDIEFHRWALQLHAEQRS